MSGRTESTEARGGMDRRRLLRLLGLAGAAPLWLAGARAWGQAPAPTSSPPGAPVATEPGPSEDARGLAAIARRRYGAHLDESQLAALTTRIDDNLKAAERMRQTKLANSDEPDVLFRAEP